MSDFRRQVFDDAAVDGVRQQFGDYAAAGYARELWRLRQGHRGATLGRLAKWLIICATLVIVVTEISLRMPALQQLYLEYAQDKAPSEPESGQNHATTARSDPMALVQSGPRRETAYPWVPSRHEEIQIDRPTRVK